MMGTEFAPMRICTGIALLVACGVGIKPSVAGPDRVAFPEGYQTNLQLYSVLNRPYKNDVRFFYASPAAAKAAVAGQPAPDGTVLVMETRKAKLGPDGNPVLDENGRFIAHGPAVGIAVQEKRKGWGDDLPPETRNGDWDYAMFKGDGTRRTKVKYGRCFSCHMNRSDRDYNFTFNKWVLDGKP